MDKAASFSLVTEPWLPVVDRTGAEKEMGLSEVLLQAHELVGIRDPSPLIQFGLYRLLVAVMLDIHLHAGFKTQYEREDLLDEGRFSPRMVDEYFSRWRERFSLFDPEFPFYQIPAAEASERELKSVAELFHHLPSGTNVVHFHHALQDDWVISPALAARVLTTIPVFTTAGGAGKSPSINGNPPYYVWVEGESLFHSLVLNGPVDDRGRGLGSPAWRAGRHPGPGEEIGQARILDAFTWRPRRVWLRPDACTGMRCSYTGSPLKVGVRQIVFDAGAKARVEAWRDPSVAYRDRAEKISPVRPSWDKPIWQDTGPLALLRSEQKQDKVSYERPGIVSAYFGQAGPEAPLAMEVYGLQTDGKMKCIDWRYERLAVPGGLEEYPDRRALAQQMVDVTEKVAYQLKKNVRQACTKGRGGEAEAAAADLVSKMLWEERQAPYVRALEQLAALSPQEDAVKLLVSWRQGTVDVAKGLLEKGLAMVGRDAEALRAQAKARATFARAVYYLIHPEEAKEKAKGGKTHE